MSRGFFRTNAVTWEPRALVLPSIPNMRALFWALTISTLLLGFQQLPAFEAIHPAFASIAVSEQRVSISGYERQLFGSGWATPQSSTLEISAVHSAAPHCNTRVWVLSTQLYDVQVSPDCQLMSGYGVDPYSEHQMAVSGDGAAIEVDHIFPLRAAWDLGAHSWDARTRMQFANDPLNLVAVSRAQNQDKSDKLPSEWLPASRRNRCWYINRLTEVAVAYSLPLPEADLKVMRRQCLLPAFLGKIR